jgi:crossover junction endodeoxyribonuclease RuvC
VERRSGPATGEDVTVLGIDPGSTVTGFAVVQYDRGRYVYVASGAIRTHPEMGIPTRLCRIHEGVAKALADHRPDSVAIEAIFRHKSSESALRLGQARGVALLACGQAGFDPTEYNNATVKASVGAHGRADKDAIARMVTLLLGRTFEGPADETDALAIAITHLARSRTPALVRG